MTTEGSPGGTRTAQGGAEPFELKLAWTWDHSTNWVPRAWGSQNAGASNPYTKRPATFVADYVRLIDFCAENGFNGVCVTGFLRDSHGGEDYAMRVAEYGVERGVRVLPVVGLCAYGGIYYEGDHEYSLEEFLIEHPDCIAVNENGEPATRPLGLFGPKVVYHACPSRKEVLDFVAESVHWAMDTFPIAGMEIETTDLGVCQCPDCRERRQLPAHGFSTEDMVPFYSACVAAARAANPEALMILETYAHFARGGRPGAPVFGRRLCKDNLAQIARFPQGCAAQWYAGLGLGKEAAVKIRCPEDDAFEWDAADRSPYQGLNIMRTDGGTQWASFRHDLFVKELREMIVRSAASGVQGISVFGECAADHPTDYLNYRAFDYFSQTLLVRSMEQFMADEAAPALGGEDRAYRFFEIFQNEECSDATVDEVRMDGPVGLVGRDETRFDKTMVHMDYERLLARGFMDVQCLRPHGAPVDPQVSLACPEVVEHRLALIDEVLGFGRVGPLQGMWCWRGSKRGGRSRYPDLAEAGVGVSPLGAPEAGHGAFAVELDDARGAVGNGVVAGGVGVCPRDAQGFLSVRVPDHQRPGQTPRLPSVFRQHHLDSGLFGVVSVGVHDEQTVPAHVRGATRLTGDAQWPGRRPRPTLTIQGGDGREAEKRLELRLGRPRGSEQASVLQANRLGVRVGEARNGPVGHADAVPPNPPAIVGKEAVGIQVERPCVSVGLPGLEGLKPGAVVQLDGRAARDGHVP